VPGLVEGQSLVVDARAADDGAERAAVAESAPLAPARGEIGGDDPGRDARLAPFARRPEPVGAEMAPAMLEERVDLLGGDLDLEAVLQRGCGGREIRAEARRLDEVLKNARQAPFRGS
jgi:hypothetical protein